MKGSDARARTRGASTSREAWVTAEPPSPLNPAQKKATEHLAGPVLVVAGAGTGKTRTLVYRMARLVESGIPNESILLLTFTRRAAGEMIDRAAGLLAGRESRIAGGTFHSFAHLMLRRYGAAIALSRDFTVLDQADSFEILSGIRSDLKLSERGRGFPRRETIAAILSKSVNEQISVGKVLAKHYPQFLHEAEPLQEIGRRYTTYKRERKLLDFDDLLVHLIQLLEEPGGRARVADRYRYVMVDEYQDTNALQARITRLLAGEAKNVMVVGDDAQSIYGFRGARYDNLFDFQEEFQRARLIPLEQNYRSTQPILDVANGLMRQMSRAFHKRLFTERRGGEKPLLIEALDESEQARWVTEEVQRQKSSGIPLREMAVLFRASRHAFGLELELAREGISYVKYGGFRFMEAAHIKDVVAPLRVLANPQDELSLSRSLMLCEGIGRAGARKIAGTVAGRPLVEALQAYPARKAAAKPLAELIALFEELSQMEASPARRLERAVEFYLPVMKLRFDDWPKRKRDLEELVGLCRRYRSLDSMLADLAIDPPSASRGDRLVAREARDELVLSTIHSAKGLEWKVVFIIQAIDGCIPQVGVFDEEEEEDQLDEELRLFYVAVTRAKDALHVVYPRETARNYGFGWAQPSRFIEALPRGMFTRREAYRQEARSGDFGDGEPPVFSRPPSAGKRRRSRWWGH